MTFHQIPTNNILDAIYAIFLNTGIFFDNCSEWDKIMCRVKIGLDFKLFTRAQWKYCSKQKETYKSGGYYGSNTVEREVNLE